METADIVETEVIHLARCFLMKHHCDSTFVFQMTNVLLEHGSESRWCVLNSLVSFHLHTERKKDPFIGKVHAIHLARVRAGEYINT